MGQQVNGLRVHNKVVQSLVGNEINGIDGTTSYHTNNLIHYTNA